MKSFCHANTMMGEDEMLALGTITANLLRGPALADTSPHHEERRCELGRTFEVTAPAMERFNDPCPSGQQVQRFLRAVIDCSEVSQSSVVAAFVLMMRLLRFARLGGASWQLAWLVSICIAQKGLDDVPLANCEFPTVLAMCAPERAVINQQRFNQLELTMLRALGWKTHVTADVFGQVVAELEHTVAAERRETEEKLVQAKAAHVSAVRQGTTASGSSITANASDDDREMDMKLSAWDEGEAASAIPLAPTLKVGPGGDVVRCGSPFVRPSPSEISRFPLYVSKTTVRRKERT